MIQEEGMRGEDGSVTTPDGCAEAETRRLLTAAFETVPHWARPDETASPARDVVGLVRQRAVRERRLRVLVPTGALALAAAVTGGIIAGAAADGGDTVSPGALQAVTAAMTKTWTQSYTFTASASQRSKHGGGAVKSPGSGSLTGQFDPATGNGEEQVHALSYGEHQWQYVDQRFRYVGGHVYASTQPGSDAAHGKAWQESLAIPAQSPNPWPGTATTGFNEGQPFNPADLLAVLKQSTSVRVAGPASGSGWTGTKYSFTETINLGGNIYFSGSVSVDSAGRVRQLVTVSDNSTSPTEGITTVTFGGFGAPVTVTAPPASQVDNLGRVSVLYIILGSF
jgi:hypothetical protein